MTGDPHIDVASAAGDLDAAADRLGAAITLLEDAVRDIQASIILVQTNAIRLRQ